MLESKRAREGGRKPFRAAHYTYDDGMGKRWEWHPSQEFLADGYNYDEAEVDPAGHESEAEEPASYGYEAEEAKQYENEEAEMFVEAVGLEAHTFIAELVGEDALHDPEGAAELIQEDPRAKSTTLVRRPGVSGDKSVVRRAQDRAREQLACRPAGSSTSRGKSARIKHIRLP